MPLTAERRKNLDSRAAGARPSKQKTEQLKRKLQSIPIASTKGLHKQWWYRSRPIVTAIGAVLLTAFLVLRRTESVQNSRTAADSYTEEADPGVHLLAHLKTKGAAFAFRPETFPGGLRGVAADRTLEPKGLIMALPLDEVLYAETVDPEVRAACRALPCNGSRALVALGVAFERAKGSKSRFAPFIETLPREVTNFVSWPMPLLKLMDFAMPSAQTYLSKELRELNGANALLKSPLNEFDLIWGVGMVQTRAFNTWDGKEALIPAAGLFNHHWDPEEVVPMPKCDTERQKCYLHAGTRSISKGQQIFFHYRPWSNFQLLIRYGFEVPGNMWGPEVSVPALTAMPPWLAKSGCKAGALQLRKMPDVPHSVPIQLPALRCAVAAAAANQSSEVAQEVEALWKAETFEAVAIQEDAASSKPEWRGLALRSLADACGKSARRWTEGEGIEAIQNAALVGTSLASAVVSALQFNLEVLVACEESLHKLADGS